VRDRGSLPFYKIFIYLLYIYLLTLNDSYMYGCLSFVAEEERLAKSGDYWASSGWAEEDWEFNNNDSNEESSNPRRGIYF